jgi:hypothetical protein
MLSRKQLENAAKCKTKTDCDNCIYDKDTRINMNDCVEQSSKTALTAIDMLKRLEWVTVGDKEGKEEMIPAILCLSCDNWKEEGHRPECELAKLLKEVEP